MTPCEACLTPLQITSEFELQPFARTLNSASQHPNTCSFPTDLSESRAKQLDFVLPLVKVEAILYSKYDASIKLDDLAGKFVVTLNQFAAHSMLDRYKPTKVKVSDPAIAINMLLNDRVDFMLMDKPMAEVMMRSVGSKVFAANTLYSGSAWLACNKLNPFGDYQQVNRAFGALLQSGRLFSSWQAASLGEVYKQMWGEHGERWRQLQRDVSTNHQAKAIPESTGTPQSPVQ